MDIIGHSEIILYLSRQKENDALSHAYFFFGPPSVGKRAVADWLANTFSQCEKIIIEPEASDEDGGAKKKISIKTVRAALSTLVRSTFNGIHRIIIVDHAEFLTIEAGNALLKRLEEPPERTHFIFTAPSVSHVLPTIASRCQQLRFSYVSREEIRQGLEVRGISQCDNVVAWAAGLPGRALRYVDEINEESFEGRMKLFDSFFSMSQADRLLAVESSVQSLEEIEQYLHYLMSTSFLQDRYKKTIALYDCLRKGYQEKSLVHIERIRDAIALKEL